VDLMTTIAACSVANDYSLVLAMVAAFSQGNVLAVQDGRELDGAALDKALGEGSSEESSHEAHTRAEALARLEQLRNAGGSPVGGLLPVPPSWATQFQREAAELFDPCVNVSVATAMIAQFERECRGRAKRACVLRRYATAAGIAGFDELVLEVIREHGLASVRTSPTNAEVLASPIYTVVTSERDWGADRLLFRSESLPHAGADAKPNESSAP